jgi:hypothetical protein
MRDERRYRERRKVGEKKRGDERRWERKGDGGRGKEMVERQRRMVNNQRSRRI